MRKFEYRSETVHKTHHGDVKEVVKIAKRLGQEGWELVSVIPTSTDISGMGRDKRSPDEYAMIFKREIITKRR